MSSEDIALVVEERTIEGKAVKQLRRDGLIPAVIHDHGKPSKIVMAPYLDVMRVYHKAGKNHTLALTLGKQKYLAIIKDVDFEPKKHQLRHVVFNALAQDEKIQTEIPVHLEGEIPAEKAGLMVITQLDSVEIESLPKDLPEQFTVDATKLVEIGDKLTVSDISVPAGVTILTEAEHPIAVVEETKAQMSEEEEAAEGEEGAEGETEEGAEGEAGAEPKEKSENE